MRTVTVPTMTLAGQQMESVEIHGNVYGDIASARHVYVIVGGITANALPFGEDGWWNALAAPPLIDLTEDAVLCPCMPGNGTTWAGLADLTPDGALPRITIADIAAIVAAFVRGSGCERAIRYVGASFGGLVGLALAAAEPQMVSRLTTISAGLGPDGWGTGNRHLQRELVREAAKMGATDKGMSWARQLGMLTYRGREELNQRFDSLTAADALPPVASYLEHNGKRFAETFPATTFLLLSDAIDRCQLAPTPEQERALLSGIRAEVAVVGVPEDLLFPWELQVALHRQLRAAGVETSLWKLESRFGHDAFLVEQEKLASLLADSQLFRPEGQAPTPHRFRQLNGEPMRTLRLGLIGCGVVGQGLLELLQVQAQDIAERYNLRFEVNRIAVRNPEKTRQFVPPDAKILTSALDVATDPEVDVVVEVAGGIDGIYAAVSAAVAAGKPVVTANKVLVANKLRDLAALSSRMATPISCEAAAAGALPIVRTLNHRADDVTSMSAIVNGTCNFVITRMEQDEMSMEAAITLAQDKGLAEADPSDDVDGGDAACKLTILAYRCFGGWLAPDSFSVRGIRELTTADCDLAQEMGFRIRHIARVDLGQSGLVAAVEPMLLPDWHLLANVEEEYNAVYLSFARSGDMSLFGKGAGGLPTGTAIISDLVDLAEGALTPWPVPKEPARAPSISTPYLYLRVSAKAQEGNRKKIESQLRRLGFTVTSRAGFVSDDGTEQIAFIVSDHKSDAIGELQNSLAGLSRISSTLLLHVLQ